MHWSSLQLSCWSIKLLPRLTRAKYVPISPDLNLVDYKVWSSVCTSKRSEFWNRDWSTSAAVCRSISYLRWEKQNTVLSTYVRAIFLPKVIKYTNACLIYSRKRQRCFFWDVVYTFCKITPIYRNSSTLRHAVSELR